MTAHIQCSACGGRLSYQPGIGALKCSHCGTENIIVDKKITIETIDYQDHINNKGAEQESYIAITVGCDTCGAEVTLDKDTAADECPFCGSMITAHSKESSMLKPNYILPFKIEKKEAEENLRKWISSLYFSPKNFKQLAKVEDPLTAMYTPAWIFDTKVFHTENNHRAHPSSQRMSIDSSSDDSNSKSEFEDFVVLAGKGLPPREADLLDPWELDSLVKYDPGYIAGFRVEHPAINLEEGWTTAQKLMQEDIARYVNKGRKQPITLTFKYDQTKFKHILLPLWIKVYKFNDEVYRVLVNARTGEVMGERPFSKWKIALLIASVPLFFAAIIFLKS
ncbi:hypothetical protein KAJ27_15430 [bacterium]|nr:hypothetical protein [Candidatus Neomarinimicrobiota bacterium]MCK5685522.1 hypothetical protein [bacterium]